MKLVYFVLVLGVLNHQSCGRWQPSKTEKLTSGQHEEVDYYYSFRFSFCFNIGRKIWYAQSFSFDFVFCLAIIAINKLGMPVLKYFFWGFNLTIEYFCVTSSSWECIKFCSIY